MKQLHLFISIYLIVFQLSAQTNLSNVIQIIPQPDKITMSNGNFQLTKDTKILYKGGDAAK
jgi:hypothetical protein